MRPFFAIFILLSCLSSTVVAQPVGGLVNLISNPGFEEGIFPWLENNYMRNEVKFVRERGNPHSGLWCMKIDFVRVVGGSDLNFVYPNLRVKANQTIRIGYWARGVSNGPALHALIRKGGPPWTKWFQAESVPTEEWQHFVHTVSLPGDLEEGQAQLLFQLKGVGKVWLDDVSVSELPPVDDAPSLAGNLVRNPSFEAGRDGWTATFRNLDFATLREESGSNYPSPENARLEVRESANAPHGKHYLSVEVKPRTRAALTSAYFKARYGHEMRLGFSLRSTDAGAHDGGGKESAPRRFKVSVASGKNSNTRFDSSSSFASASGWKSYSMPVKLKPGLDGVYCLSFEFLEPGRYELDAVSLIESKGAVAPEDMYPEAVAIDPDEAAGRAPIGNLYSQDEGVFFRLVIAGAKVRKRRDCRIRVVDWQERVIKQISVVTVAGDDGRAAKSFEVPTSAFGAFRIEARDAGSGQLLAEQIYSVLPPLPLPAERPDSFFGAHVDLTSWNLEIARKAGFRWLRLYPPLITQWMVVEQAPGQWTFQTDGVKRAKDMGFRILANLGTTPDFAADVDPSGIRSRWTRSYPPSDLSRWKEYVTRTFNAFEPFVDAWEIWNEPDGLYMLVKPGLDKSDVYLSLLKAAREAMDATGKPFFLLGPAVAQVNAPLGWEILEKGGGGLLDAWSFHFYSLMAGGSSPDTEFVAPLLEKYVKYRNHAGEPLPLWHTEGASYLAGSQSWLRTYRVPPSSASTPAQAAASVIRGALFFKALGVKRHFPYQAGSSEAGRRVHEDITEAFIDATGIPGPGIAGHAAMVALTEDLQPGGFETRIVDGITVRIAHFSRGMKKTGGVSVFWADAPVALSRVLDRGEAGHDTGGRSPDIRDMMGNRILSADAQAGEFPIYVVGEE